MLVKFACDAVYFNRYSKLKHVKLNVTVHTKLHTLTRVVVIFIKKEERRPTFSRITPGTQSGGGNDGLVPSYRRVTKREEIPTGGSNPRPKEREV